MFVFLRRLVGAAAQFVFMLFYIGEGQDLVDHAAGRPIAKFKKWREL